MNRDPLIVLRNNKRDLVVATHVCRLWRGILTSKPGFWTRINCEGDYDRVRSFLKRSEPEPIDVTVGKRRNLNDMLQPKDVTRMKTLYIKTEINKIVEMSNSLNQEKPYLQSLTIEGVERDHYHRPVYGNGLFGPYLPGSIPISCEFLGRHTPSLQRLTFRLVCPSVLSSMPLPNLTHIDWVAEKAHINLDELLKLFVSSPLLEDITIVAQFRPGGSRERVTLNKLRKMVLNDHHPNGSINLMHHLTAPNLSYLSITRTHVRDPQGRVPTIASILSTNSKRIPLLLEPTSVLYNSGPGNLSCTFGYSEPSKWLHISLSNSWGEIEPLISGWFVQGLPISFSKVQELKVQWAYRCHPLDDYPIGQFQNLLELSLEGEFEVDLLFELIQMNFDGPTPCPSLSKIQILSNSHGYNRQKLEGILKERVHHGAKVTEILEARSNKYAGAEIEELKWW
jgi:hypothetical protein